MVIPISIYAIDTLKRFIALMNSDTKAQYLPNRIMDRLDKDGLNIEAGYGQIEAAKRPRKATLQKAAEALGITLEQLAY